MRDDPKDEFLTDPQAAALFQLGSTRFAELQREADFPAPVWLGPRGKRHLRSALMAYALQKRSRATDAPSPPMPAPPEASPQKRLRGRPPKALAGTPAAEATT